MNINRLNYEEYFILYIDNELSPAERQEVEQFIAEQADLRVELEMLEQTVIRPDRKLVFEDKAQLMKGSALANPVNEANCEEYFILYGDNELTNEEQDFVEQFVYRNPAWQTSFEAYQLARFRPDTSITFPEKSVLYRSEESEKVVVMRWWKIAVAAVLLLSIGGTAWYYNAQNTTDPGAAIAGSSDTPRTQIQKALMDAPPARTALAQAPVNNNPVEPKMARKLDRTRDVAKGEQNLLTEKPDMVLAQAAPPVAETISVNASNILQPQPVTLTEASTAGIEPNIGTNRSLAVNSGKTESAAISAAFEALNANDPEPMNVSYASNDESTIDVLNTSVANKGKLRGFFRKVSRVVDKATHLSSDDEEPNDKKGLRIASFEIALK